MGDSVHNSTMTDSIVKQDESDNDDPGRDDTYEAGDSSDDNE